MDKSNIQELIDEHRKTADNLEKLMLAGVSISIRWRLPTANDYKGSLLVSPKDTALVVTAELDRKNKNVSILIVKPVPEAEDIVVYKKDISLFYIVQNGWEGVLEILSNSGYTGESKEFVLSTVKRAIFTQWQTVIRCWKDEVKGFAKSVSKMEKFVLAARWEHDEIVKQSHGLPWKKE
jgi:hypothetical protein